ncbi:MAG: pyridoxamine 5'-phosphate oxidase family protein [Candidatus Bathyarchaeia archaeon]
MVGNVIYERSEIEKIFMKAKVGRLAMCLNNKPYVVPIAFVYSNGKIYFHSANRGEKIRIMKMNPLVCFEVDEYELVLDRDPCKITFRYESAIAFGKVRFLETKEDKLKILKIMTYKYDPGHLSKPLEESMIPNDLIVGEISIELMTGKRNI